MGVHGQLDADVGLDGDRFTTEPRELLLEQLRVRVEPDAGDLPRLLGAEHRAGAAQLEVPHRDREPGAEARLLGDRREPLMRLLGHRRVRGEQQVRVAALARSSDPSAELVHLTEPQQVRALDDERVRVRDVEAGLDDGRAHEHVELALPEAQHDLLERTLVQLAVRDPHARVRDQPGDAVGDLVDRVDLVVDVEDLPVAEQLATDGELDLALVERLDDGHDGLTVLGRRLNH